MEAARAAIANHTSRKGHYTDVSEHISPAVTWEHVHPTREENITEAVDREVHQHHYHTTVQPLSHKEVLPTQHTHNLLPAVRKSFVHDDVEATNRRVSQEKAKFKNFSRVHPTTHSVIRKEPVLSTHYHHHVHETVQPIIYKETHQPEIVHTMVPIHEHHTDHSQHHGISQLPLRTMDDFKDSLSNIGTTHNKQQYQGAPRAYNQDMGTTFEKLVQDHHNKPSPTHIRTSMNGNTPIQVTNGNENHQILSPQTPTHQHHNRHNSGMTGSPPALTGHHRRGSNSSSSFSSVDSIRTPRDSTVANRKSLNLNGNSATSNYSTTQQTPYTITNTHVSPITTTTTTTVRTPTRTPTNRSLVNPITNTNQTQTMGANNFSRPQSQIQQPMTTTTANNNNNTMMTANPTTKHNDIGLGRQQPQAARSNNAMNSSAPRDQYPSKLSQQNLNAGQQPVRIVNHDESPRHSDEAGYGNDLKNNTTPSRYGTGKRSFLSRLTGGDVGRNGTGSQSKRY